VFSKIMVCLDGSVLAEQVLPYAIEVAQAFKARLAFFSALPEPVIVAPGIPGIAPVPVETDAMVAEAIKGQAEAEAYLSCMVGRASENGVKAEKMVANGSPGPTILDFAEKHGVGLIAIATHGKGGLERVVMGSVADYLLRHSKIPIFVVRPKKG
jgi:nucleotide-binding universal stress UspA family protein